MSKRMEVSDRLHTFIDDILMHTAVSNDVSFQTGTDEKARKLRLEMIHHPSHLETAPPICCGKAKAK